MPYLASLDDQVVDRARGEVVADGEAGMAGPDHQGGRAGHAGAHPTSTVTFVGLVRMSNTAERFCDCATRASMSSASASASIS